MNFGKIARRHRLEVIAGVLGIGISATSLVFSVSVEIAFLAGVFSASLAMAVALVKVGVSAEIERLVSRISPTLKRTNEINELMLGLEAKASEIATVKLSEFIAELRQIRRGRMVLSEPEYFQRIIDRMQACETNKEIYATNSIDVMRWREDPRQLHYKQANERALDSGSRISRIFIIEKARLPTLREANGLDEVIRQKADQRMSISVVWRESLVGVPELIDDWVMFADDEPEIYIAYSDKVVPTRVSNALLCTGVEHSNSFLEKYRRLNIFTISDDEFETEIIGH